MVGDDPLRTVERDVRLVYEAARTYARDRYLAALLAPSQARDDLVTIAAFVGELERIPLIAHDATIGQIRFQWWRDALAAPVEASSGHPVADEVRALARRRGLPASLLALPIEGYARALYEDGIPDEDGLFAYADETEGSAIRLSLSVLGGFDSAEAQKLVVPAAIALAMTRLALTLPQHFALGRMPLPAAFAGQTRDPRGADEGAAREAAREHAMLLAGLARAHLARFRGEQSRLDAPRLIEAFLPLCLVEPYLKAVLRPRRDALLELADISPLSRVSRLWFARWRRRV